MKLADFGSAKQMRGRLGEAPPPHGHHSLIGTPEYMAPEVLLGNEICETCDWWSFGCLVTELLVGTTPFFEPNHGVQDLVRKILYAPISLPEHAHVGEAEVAFIAALLDRDPSTRLGARPGGHTAVLAHPWFAGISATRLLTKQVAAPWLPHLNGPQPNHEPSGIASGGTNLTVGQLEVLATHAHGRLHLEEPPTDQRVPPFADPLEQWGTRVTLHLETAPLDMLHQPQIDSAAAPKPTGDESLMVVETDEETEEETEERDAAAEEEEEQGVIGVSTVPITPWEEEAMAEAGTEAAVADEEGGAREADDVAGALSASSEFDSPTSLLTLHADMSAAPAPGWKVSDNVNASAASDSATAQPRSRYARQPTSGTTSLTGFDRLASPLGRRAGMPGAGTTV